MPLRNDSPQTIARLYMDLKDKQTQTQKDVEYIKQDVGEIKSSIKEFHIVFGEFKKELKDDNDCYRKDIKDAISEKANLWVEWFCKTVIGGIALGVLGLFLFVIQELIKK